MHSNYQEPPRQEAGGDELKHRLHRVDAPDGFAERVLARLTAEEPPGRLPLGHFPFRGRLNSAAAIAAALLLAVLVPTVAHLRERSQQRQAEVAAQQFATAMRLTDRAVLAVETRVFTHKEAPASEPAR